MSAIDEKYGLLGGAKGFLGEPTTGEASTPDSVGRFRHFQGGSIYWTPQTGAHEVHGDIRSKWSTLGWERSFLGYPLTDETTAPDGIGRFNRFQGGSIYWTPWAGANETHAGSPTGYIISVDAFHISNTRSVHEDTDYVSLAVQAGTQEPLKGSFFAGDVNNGDHAVRLKVGPVSVAANEGLTFSYLVLNKGHSGTTSDILEKVGQASVALLGGALGASGATLSVVNGILNELFSIIFADCDGTVASDKIVVPRAQLDDWTDPAGGHSEKRHYPGSNSPTGCGSNSIYDVTWSIIRV